MMITDAIKNLYKKITGKDVTDKSENQIAELIQELENRNLTAIPTCSYAVKWFEKHPEHGNLLNQAG